ncbi:MAG: hypothetical protein HY655_05170 [Acidobacteria bacterium]|nr:hypothetical protein [Acidobacteriota bacterium]
MKARWIAAGAVAFGGSVAALRVLGMAGFANEHFYYLSRAEQVLHGAWPVRDFIDQGIPLQWGLSLAALAVGGHTLLSEAVLVAAAFGVSAGLTLWIVAWWTDRPWLGVWAAFVQLAILPRSYSYPKILAYVLAAAAFMHYARKPSVRSIVLLAAATAMVFLFRHDHGVYVGAAACILVAGFGDTGGVVAATRRVAILVATGALLVMPYLVYVAFAEGLSRYFDDGLRFSEREADRTLLGFPGLAGVPLWSSDGLSVVAYYAFWLTPLIAAGAAWSLRRLPPATRRVVTAIAAMAVIMNPGLLRDPLTSRVPETIVPFTLLAAWLASLLWGAKGPAAVRSVLRGATAALIVAIAAAAATIGNFTETLERAEMLHRPPRPLLRWREVSAELREPYAERQMPSDTAFALVPFFQYVQTCSPPAARILVAGPIPELSFYARRGFAGGQPALDAVYYTSRELDRRIVEQMQRELVLYMVAAPDGMEQLAQSYPIVLEYVKDRFVPMADFAVGGSDRPARVYVSREVAPAPTDRDTGWPCPGSG